ncbi:MAG: hypothetical protein HDR72_00790, partial [Ruminococcaceae bacterium]|nr:hypothetical protein [Oscillospiraceae bacterium]
RIDMDLHEYFGYVNIWWVFAEVSKKLSYSIFMAEVDHIGYKRTSRSEKETVNELYRSANNEPIIDDDVFETVLDEMRKIKWD